jgi:hypothetical protein
MLGPDGQPVRIGGSGFATKSGNISNSPDEMFVAYHPDNTSSTDLIDPSEPAILKNVGTGLWCRLASLPSNATQIGLICDAPDPSQATVMDYTGNSMAIQGNELVAWGGDGSVMLLTNTTDVAPPPPGSGLGSILPVVFGTQPLHTIFTAGRPCSCQRW